MEMLLFQSSVTANRHLYGHLTILPSCVRVVVLFGGCLTVKN